MGRPSEGKDLAKPTFFLSTRGDFFTREPHPCRHENCAASPANIVLVGGGLAAQRCAETLRRAGYDGAIRMVCAERHPPYDRPPLSKELLAGSFDEPSLALRPAEWYASHDVELLLGVGAAGLRAPEHRVSWPTAASCAMTDC